MPSFASEIKREICNVPIKAPCCSVAELAGVICYGAIEKNNVLYVKTEASFVAKRIYQLAKEGLNVKCKVIKSGNSRKIYRVELASGDEIAKVYELTGVKEQTVREDVIEKLFLNGGVVLPLSAETSLEIDKCFFALSQITHTDEASFNINFFINFVTIQTETLWQLYIFTFHFVNVSAPTATSIRWVL